MDDSRTKAWFACSIQEMQHSMYRVAYAILGNEKDCEDAAGNAILLAYQKLEQLGNRHKFKAWFMRILRNECINILRGRRSHTELSEDIAAAPESGNAELYHAILRLKEEYRICIVLHYLEGYKVTEISAIMGMPAGTVKSCLFRARAELKSALNESEDTYER